MCARGDRSAARELGRERRRGGIECRGVVGVQVAVARDDDAPERGLVELPARDVGGGGEMGRERLGVVAAATGDQESNESEASGERCGSARPSTPITSATVLAPSAAQAPRPNTRYAVEPITHRKAP